MAAHASPHRLTPMSVIMDLTATILILAALIVAMQTAWPYLGAGLDSDTNVSQVEDATRTRTVTVTPGRAVTHHTGTPPIDPMPADQGVYGRLWIPRLGVDWSKPIQQGVEKAVLANYGLGHYPSTVAPGMIGNTAMAGHRTPSDLGYMDTLREGDMIYVQGPRHWYAYRVNRAPYTVPMERTDVIGPKAAGASRGLTLTTCEPMFSPTPAKDRMIVHAQLVWWGNAGEGMPAEYTHPTRTVGQRVTRTVRDVSTVTRIPVTGVIAAMLAVAWLAWTLICWLIWHRATVASWRDHPSVSPVTWLWRLQAGPHGDRAWVRVAGMIIRLIGLTLFLAAVTFAYWRWAAPWASEAMPWLAGSTPTV